MHTLRYIMGDDKFFPALKKLATDTTYTYNNLVNTTDVQLLFSKAYGTDLAPLFQLYLYSTDKLGIHVQQTAFNMYTITLENIDMPLPLDIITSEGTQRKMVDKKGVVVKKCHIAVN